MRRAHGLFPKTGRQQCSPCHILGVTVVLIIVISVPVTECGAAWEPPIGIPEPEFGIDETHYMYEGQTYDFGSGPESYRDAGNGPYTHYVDNTHPSATDSGNPYGTASTPRNTIPRDLAAGSVVEIHGGPYTYKNAGDKNILEPDGSVDLPIFVRGTSVQPQFRVPFNFAGQYMIFENIHMYDAGISVRLPGGSSVPFHHISIRNCEVEGDGTEGSDGGVSLGYDETNHIVIYNNHIHHYGDYAASVENDRHGTTTGINSHYIWIVDNHIHHNGGDSYQGGHSAQYSVTHVYIGRNVMHDDGENAIDLKEVTDVIVSQNTMYNYPLLNASSNGVITVSHYGSSSLGTQRAWFLFNEMYAADRRAGQVSGGAGDIYYIGNTVYDIGEEAFRTWGSEDVYFVGNTMQNVGVGVSSTGSSYTATIANNIFGSLNDLSEPHIFLEDGTYRDNAIVTNNLFQDSMNVNTDSDNYIEGDPEFVDGANNDFRLEATSPAGATALSSGVVAEIYDRFEQLYGVDIRKDIEGTSLTEPWDIGAYKSANRAPVLGAIGDRSVYVNSLLSLTLSATDADGDALTYSATGLPTGATLTGASFSWTPQAGQVGSHDITFIASDGSAQDTETITVTVSSSTNSAPVLASIGDRSVAEGGSLGFTISATDVDGDALTYSATGLPTGASFSGQTFSWTPGYDQAGPHDVTFTASDGEATDSETITVTVSNTNRAPVLASIGDRAVAENSALSFGISASDADGETLSYSATGLPSGASLSGQTFTWTPSYDQAGSHSVTFTVSDGTAQDSEAISIAVSNVNRAPVLAAIANQAVDHSTLLTFNVSASDPDGDALSYSVTGSPSGATFSSQTFSWTPSLSQAGTFHVTFAVSDADLTDSQSVTIAVSDALAPVVTNLAPAADAIQAPVNGLITLHIVDAGIGVNAASVIVTLDGATIYTGDVSDYSSATGHCYRIGTEADYAYVYQANEPLDFDEVVTVTVNAADLGGIGMTPYSYSFRTEMRAFGASHIASWAPQDTDKGSPATVRDSGGNIWVVYHAGAVGARDIYASRRGVGEAYFAGPTQLTADSGDQSHPDIAVGADDKLYVVWQDNRRGNWDIYGRTSADGTTWSAETRVSNSDDNELAPATVVDSESSPTAYVTWQDDSAGHEDIYVADSSDDFATTTITRITSDVFDQTAPALAVDASGTVYVVWTDDRGGSDDIYGASSTYGPWTNVALITGAGDQSTPAVATEASGSILHFAWADDVGGDSDICYAASNAMPATPGSTVNVIDDGSGADQLTPAIITTGSTGDHLKIFLCWQDWRNFVDGRDTDLYFVQVKTGADTNVLVGDGATGSDQSEPDIGIDGQGEPYVVWTDHRNGHDEIYQAGSSVMDDAEVDSDTVTASAGGTVGVTSPSAAGDVGVEVPAGACSYDLTIRIVEMNNPQAVPTSASGVVAFDFGPSGLEFDPSVTITIAYAVADFPNGAPTPYWYDALTGALAQTGISNITRLEISDTVHAIRFQTTHFTPYYLVGTVAAGGGGGGGGGGGCALSPSAEEDFMAFLLPYLGIGAIMVVLRWRDRKARRDLAGGAQG